MPVRPHFDALKMEIEGFQGQVPHLDDEAGPLSQRHLVERDRAAKCGLKCTAHSAFDVLLDKSFEHAVGFVPHHAWDAEVRSSIQGRRAVVGIEEIDAKTCDRKSCRLSTPRWASHNEHPGRHLPAEITVGILLHVIG